MSNSSTSNLPIVAESADHPDAFEHVLVVDDGAPTECTIFPRDCDDEDILTNWITAGERSFVSLDTVR